MAVQRRWRNVFDSVHSVDVTCTGEEYADRIDGSLVEYEIEFATGNATCGDQDGVVTTDQLDGVTVNWTQGGPSYEFVVTVPDGAGVVRVYVCHDEQRFPIYLPGPTFLQNCTDAIDGDTDAARYVTAKFAAPPQIPAVCGAFLTVREVGRLIETLTRVDGYTQSYLHSYRYSLVRGAIGAPGGLSVQSAEELETLVESLDDIDGIGRVKLVDALSDTMATVLPSEEGTRAMLDDLGYDLPTVKRFDDDLFFACCLAQLVVTDGIRAAEGRAMGRRWHLDGNYERRKAQAKNAEYHDRGRVWRELLCLAARQSLDEFAYTLANAFYWSGEVLRTDSRMDELLFEAASTVAAAIGFTRIEGRARYERHLSRGHRLRSQNCYSMARKAFDRAADVAAEYDFLPEWEPVYARATVRSAELGTAGNHEQAVATLDDALGHLLGCDIPSAKLNHIVHHIEGQKLESKAKLSDYRGDSDDPVSLLREARAHYDAIGFDRSRERTHQKLQRAKRQAPAAESKSPSTTETAREAVPEKQTEETPTEARTSGPDEKRERRTGGHVRSGHARTEFEANPELNDFLTPPDPNEVGSADLMTSPEDRDEDPFASPNETWASEERTEPEGYPE